MDSMMCLRESPRSLWPLGPVGPKTLVKTSRDSRRSPLRASPKTVSAAVLAYTSAVSKVLIPASSAARTHWVATSFSTCDPWVSQLPKVISEILKPLWPRYLNSMGPNVAQMPSGGKGSAGLALRASFSGGGKLAHGDRDLGRGGGRRAVAGARVGAFDGGGPFGGDLRFLPGRRGCGQPLLGGGPEPVRGARGAAPEQGSSRGRHEPAEARQQEGEDEG